LRHYTKYRVLKTSWGIAIDFTGNIKEVNSSKTIITISDNSLAIAHKEQIELGFKSLSVEIADTNKTFYIDIQKVDFNLCDFQIDGLYWACREWLSKALNIRVTEPEIIYDKVGNK
jgi:hypothetical protein